ncbi:MAG: InlB B-repeat-containing protein [Collinsella sp.]|nr:InlB B-repeat-containing protein [Collinsella sp.]
MLSPRHQAVAAGLAISLTLGAAAAPQVAGADTRAVTEADGSLYEQSGTGLVDSIASLFAGKTSSLSAVSLSDEMKYFTAFESNKNYDQGLSSGDGYNAMGYYQFDRRYALIPFLEQVYAYNPTKYAMLEGVLRQGSAIKNGTAPLYDSSSKSLTSTGALLNDAWHAAYRTDAAEFSALQDSYAYNEYYKPVETTLRNRYGLDISGRSDAIKGLAWGMSNLFGTGGVRSFFDWAKADSGLSNSMSDREIALALTNAVIDHIKEYAPRQSQYWNGWINRYKREQAIVLNYVAEDEQQAAAGAGSNAGAGSDASANAGDTGSTGAEDSSAPAAPSEDAGSGADAGAAEDSAPTASGSDTGVTVEKDAGTVDDATAPADNSAAESDAAADDAAESDAATEDTSAEEDLAGGAASEQPSDEIASDQEDAAVQKRAEETAPAEQAPVAPATYTVTFTSKGEVVDSAQVSAGQTVSATAKATAFNGYSFVGWYLNGEPFDFSTPITADTELVAYYRKDEADTKGAAQKSTASPDGLPQTGDTAAIAAMGAAGVAMVGASALALGAKRRREGAGA